MYYEAAEKLHALVQDRGGFVNAHMHLDLAYSLDLPEIGARLRSYVSGDAARAGELPLPVKIAELDLLLRESPEHLDTVGDRITRAITELQEQGGRAARTCITVGTELAPSPLEQAARIRDELAPGFVLQITALPLRSLGEPTEFKHFAALCGSPLIDVIGALPQNAAEDAHSYFERIFLLANETGKPVEAHADEYLRNDERETEALARAALRAREHGYRQPVSAVHCVTLAAHPRDYRLEIARLLAEAEVGVVICPRAALSMKAIDEPTFMHNAIAPLRELIAEGVTVALGTDNIRDIFTPLSGGRMMEEIEFLAEATRIFDFDLLASIATANGARLLGL